MKATPHQVETLRRQLARAIEIGDHAAEVMLRARLKAAVA
jgi:hypothetical protein